MQAARGTIPNELVQVVDLQTGRAFSLIQANSYFISMKSSIVLRYRINTIISSHSAGCRMQKALLAWTMSASRSRLHYRRRSSTGLGRTELDLSSFSPSTTCRHHQTLQTGHDRKAHRMGSKKRNGWKSHSKSPQF